MDKSEKNQSRLRWAGSPELEAKRQHFERLLPFYRWRVRLTKFLLPLIALLLVGLLVIWPRIYGEDNRFRLGMAQTETWERLETGLSVLRPRLVGIDKKDQPFVVTADTATQESQDNPAILLENPVADLTLKAGSWVVLSSRTAEVNEQNSRAVFYTNVTLLHDDGYEVRGDEIVVNTKTGHVQSRRPVTVKGPMGQIDAKGFELNENGALLTFTGPAHMTLYAEVQ